MCLVKIWEEIDLMSHINHMYEKLHLIRVEGSLVFSNTGNKKYGLKRTLVALRDGR